MAPLTEFSMPDTTSLRESSLPIIWVLGGPGSGKGTQCDRIVAKYQLCHISTGDLLREEVASGSDRAAALQAIMSQGQLVPMNVVLGLLAEKMLRELGTSKGFLIDGYPRELVQGQEFEKQIGECRLVVYLEVGDATLKSRLLGRALSSGRQDDNEETINKRLDTFHSHNDPIVQHYTPKTAKIDGESTPDEIFAQIEKRLDEILK